MKPLRSLLPLRLCVKNESRFAAPSSQVQGALFDLMLGRRERASLDIAAVAIDRVPDDVAQVGILPHEFRHMARRQAKQVARDQNLPIAVRTRADADSRNFESRRD